MKFSQMLAVGLIGITLNSCKIFSDNPVKPGENALPVDVESYIGKWYLTEWLGESREVPVEVDVSQIGIHSVEIEMNEDGKIAVERGVLAQTGPVVTISLGDDGDETWTILQIVEQDGNSIALKYMDFTAMEKSVQSGAVLGAINQVDRDDLTIELSASSSELAQFISQNPTAFNKTLAILSRSH